MNLERLLCDAFCEGISVKEVGAGLSVATSFEDSSGDRIGFFVVRAGPDQWKIEDDGSLVPSLIAMGVNVASGTRAAQFQSMLAQSQIDYDPETGELATKALSEHDLPMAAMRFVTLLLRAASLKVLHPDVVTSTFRDDAIARIKADLGASFTVQEDAPVSPALVESVPDVLLTSDSSPPIAVFIASNNERLYEAMFLRFAADHEAHIPVHVVGLIDREGSKLISKRVRQRAANRLDAMPVFYGEEGAAMTRILREANPGIATIQ
jgi:hypothetical protein